MKPHLVPTGGEIAREALIVVAGAVVAAIIMGALPEEWKAWIKRQWQ